MIRLTSVAAHAGAPAVGRGSALAMGGKAIPEAPLALSMKTQGRGEDSSNRTAGGVGTGRGRQEAAPVPKKTPSGRDHLIAPRRTVAKTARVNTEPSPTRCFSGGARRSPWVHLTVVLLAALFGGASLSSCSSTPSHDRRLLKSLQPPQPMLAGAVVCCGGVLKVECWLGPTVRLKRAAGNGGRADQGGQPPAEPGSTDGPFRKGAANYSAQEIDEMYGRINYESVLPARLALTLSITNSGDRPVKLIIADVNSPLGDFAPRPESLTVAPGQQGSVDPMLSNRDDNFDELDVTLIIKAGGQKETQVLSLQRIP